MSEVAKPAVIMSRSTRRQSDKSNGSMLNDSTRSLRGRSLGIDEMEYFWTTELNSDIKSFTFMSKDDMEDDDEDFIEHTLFLKMAVLGPNAVPGETNIVMLESPGSDGKEQKGCIVSLIGGKQTAMHLDLTVSGRVGPATFTLIEGSGPVHMSGNVLMEYPKEDSMYDHSQTESEEEETEEEEAEAAEEVDAKKAEVETKKSAKRKAGEINGKQKQKAKMDVDQEEEDSDEEEEEEEEEEESEEEESEEEVKVKTKKGKDVGKKETSKTKPGKKPPTKKTKK